VGWYTGMIDESYLLSLPRETLEPREDAKSSVFPPFCPTLEAHQSCGYPSSVLDSDATCLPSR
jgi:hypothetical protein